MEPVIVTLIVFGSTGLIIWKFLESRNRERMAMIEKGVNPAEFKGVPFREMFRANPLSSLKWGLLAMFVGLGIVVANVLDKAYYMHDSIYLSCMLMFGGLGLIIFYGFAARRMKKEEN